MNSSTTSAAVSCQPSSASTAASISITSRSLSTSTPSQSKITNSYDGHIECEVTSEPVPVGGRCRCLPDELRQRKYPAAHAGGAPAWPRARTPTPGPVRARCVRHRRARRRAVADDPRRVERAGQRASVDGAVHRHLGGVRHRTGGGRHVELLVRFRRGDRARPDPDRRVRDHDPLVADRAGDRRSARSPPPADPHRRVRLARPRRSPQRPARRRPIQPRGRIDGGRRRRPAVLDHPRRGIRTRRLSRGLPRRVGVQQRRIRLVQRQPDRLPDRSAAAGRAGADGDRRRPRVPRLAADRPRNRCARGGGACTPR